MMSDSEWAEAHAKCAEERREESEDGLYLDDQLRQIREFLVLHKAPEEFLDTIDYFIEDNMGWVSCGGSG